MKTCITLLLWGQQHLWLCLPCRYHSQKGWSPDVQGVSWRRGRAGSSPAHQPLVLCLEALAGIRAPTVHSYLQSCSQMRSLSKGLASPDSPGVGERNYSHFIERAFLALRFK